jgi:DNA polymerase
MSAPKDNQGTGCGDRENSTECASRPVVDNSTRLAYLEAMGIQTWGRRYQTPRESASSDAVGTPQRGETQLATPPKMSQTEHSPSADTSLRDVMGMDWVTLNECVSGCTLCDLHKSRTQSVFGVGDRDADWLFIGEAPGAEEDRQGEPFVGRAGQLLNNVLKAIGLSRERVYIANILKCRPPGNRDPRPEESQACRPYLRRQIELLNPKVIIALGRIAAQNLLQTETPISKMRGREYSYENSGIPVVVTYHPAYLLRSPREKRKVWQDLQLALKLIG